MRKYIIIYDDGHDYGELTFWSKYRAGSKANKEDAFNEMVSSFGYKRAKLLKIISILRCDLN